MFRSGRAALPVAGAVCALLLPSIAVAQRCPPVSLYYVVRDADGRILNNDELRTVLATSPDERGDVRRRLGSVTRTADGMFDVTRGDGTPRLPALQYRGGDDCELALDDVTLVHRGAAMRLGFDVFQTGVTFGEAEKLPLKAPYHIIVDSLPFQAGTFVLELDRWLAQYRRWGDWDSAYPTIPAEYWRRASDAPGFDYSADAGGGREIELVLQSMAALPGDRVFVGGTYHNGAVPVHSALLVSRTGGKHWVDAGIEIGRAGVRRLAAFGPSHVWALVTFQTEGVDGPVAIVRSADAGATWETLDLRLPVQSVGVAWVETLRFYDTVHGLLSLRNANEETFIFETRDGGETWAVLWEAPLDGGLESFVYPQADVPLHATLWADDSGYYEAIGLARVLDDPQSYVVEHGPEWRAVGSIARRYEVVGTALVEKSALEVPAAR